MRLSLPAAASRSALVIAAALPTALGALAVTGPASASATSDAPAYTLASTVSPAPLSAAACASDPACVAAPAPKGGTADDYAALAQAISTAAGKSKTAVMAADGTTVVTPATTATVLLQAGTYRLTSGLKLPANVNLRGAGITATTLLMDPTVNWRNFSYTFLIRPSDTKQAGSTNLVSDLTVNGNCRTGAGSTDPAALPAQPGQICDFRATTGANSSTGGGISAGDRWTVRQVRFTNLEYFKLWILGTTGVNIVDNRFDNWGGAESDGEDNIGGGGRNDGTVIESNQYDATANGNFFDFTNAIRTVVRNNVVHTTPAVAAARGVREYGNLYFEGVIGATVTGNTLEGSHIVLSSNANYSHVAPNKDVTQPRDNTVSGNKIFDSATDGVLVRYDDYLDADGTLGTAGGWNDVSTAGTDHISRPGGNNVIQDNDIVRSRETGIIVFGTPQAKDTADTISGNRIVNAGFGGSTTYNTGAGWFDTAGIGLGTGNGDLIQQNTIIDDQINPTLWYGVQLGARKSTAAPTGSVLGGNTTTGLISAAVRTGSLAPEAPGNPAVASGTLTWDESYAGSNPVAGYRVYRNGLPVADLPVGSATVPGNLLDSDAASLETASAGTAGWTTGSTTRASRVDTSGAVGTASLALTATATGQINTYSRKVTVTAGATYTSVASFQATTTGRKVRAGLAFTDATGKITRLATGNLSATDPTGGWVTSSYTAAAPSGAVTVQAFLMVENVPAGETHLLDRLGLVTGTNTEQVAIPSDVPGQYQVVGYRADSGDDSAVTTVALP